ncbi:DNA-binding protein [Enterococcus sp. JM9B]|uniref:DNA-binding protein n=1 Tax=Enterococcus sp. JM9B TaxID=1857216 RepID=UPI001374C0F6|nr:DNA-binding protein [Enterococcus sp. JM9B]KAF1304848.1 hypothetical protein BAU16_01365 [Enterococcus sp. JM9B]
MNINIESVDLSQEAMRPLVIALAQALEESMKLRVTREELPEYMTKGQAQQYLNVSYNTLMKKYVSNGLKVKMIDGIMRISKKDCDEFMNKYTV